jgi:hypothetical protein
LVKMLGRVGERVEASQRSRLSCLLVLPLHGRWGPCSHGDVAPACSQSSSRIELKIAENRSTLRQAAHEPEAHPANEFAATRNTKSPGACPELSRRGDSRRPTSRDSLAQCGVGSPRRWAWRSCCRGFNRRAPPRVGALRQAGAMSHNAFSVIDLLISRRHTCLYAKGVLHHSPGLPR